MPTYPRAPLQTATAEFRFRPGEPWDLTVPGLLYERVRASYPQKRHGRRLELQTRLVDGQIVPLVRDQAGELQFLAPDGLSGLKIDVDQLAFQRVGPYPGWEVLRSEVLDVVRSYVEIAGPAGFEQMRLHYLNRIRLDPAPQQVDVSRLVGVWPRVPSNLASTFGKFLVKIDLPEPALHGHLVLTTGIADPTPAEPGVGLLLDLDLLSSQALALEDLEDWLEGAHRRIVEAFELCITDEARKLFQG
jgi:uncharacterized protein (TIGR04255 family)